MKIAVIALIGLFAFNVHAADGNPVGCFDLSVLVPTDADDKTEGVVYLPMNSSMCVTEANLVVEDQQLQTATGNFRIAIKNAVGKEVAVYNYDGKMTDNAAGTSFIYYTNDLPALKAATSYYGVTEFHMLNDHTKKGDVAGTVIINDLRMILIEQ